MDNDNQNTSIALAYTLGQIVFAELVRRDGDDKAREFVLALDGATRPGTPERKAQDAARARLLLWFGDAPNVATGKAYNRRSSARPDGVAAFLRGIEPGQTVVTTRFSCLRIGVEASRVYGRGVISCRTLPDCVYVTRKAST